MLDDKVSLTIGWTDITNPRVVLRLKRNYSKLRHSLFSINTKSFYRNNCRCPQYQLVTWQHGSCLSHVGCQLTLYHYSASSSLSYRSHCPYLFTFSHIKTTQNLKSWKTKMSNWWLDLNSQRQAQSQASDFQ